MDIASDIEEERRLFFVGITRARKRLCITLSRYRTVHGMTNRTIDSQFLFEAGLRYQEQGVLQGSSGEPVVEKPSGVYYEMEISDENQQLFTAGQLVSHKKFGLGRVKEFHNLGENSIVVVQFKSGQVRPLMLKYANLTIIE
jgi:DNA helicase-2/ATP-dependent DNA helicase PcrA